MKERRNKSEKHTNKFIGYSQSNNLLNWLPKFGECFFFFFNRKYVDNMSTMNIQRELTPMRYFAINGGTAMPIGFTAF